MSDSPVHPRVSLVHPMTPPSAGAQRERDRSQHEKEHLKKYTELNLSLQYSLHQEMKKNGELEKEITRMMILQQKCNLHLQNVYICLDEKNTLQQKLLSVKAIQKKCEKLRNIKEKWKQEAVNLRKHGNEYGRIL